MRVIGVALLVSVLCAACALQPADSGDEGAYASQAGENPRTPPASTWGTRIPTGGAGTLVNGGSSNSAPAQLAPAAVGNPDNGSTCTDPGSGCDPHPQPWGPPVQLAVQH